MFMCLYLVGKSVRCFIVTVFLKKCKRFFEERYTTSVGEDIILPKMRGVGE